MELQSRAPAGNRSRWLGATISLAALVVLALVVVQSDWRSLLQPLAQARLEWIVLAIASAFTVELAKTARWQLLLGLHVGAFPRLLSVLFSGRLLNVVAPLRAGDLWRIAAAARIERKPLAIAAGSVVVEKLLDGGLLATVGASTLFREGAAADTALLTGGVAVAAAAAIVLVGARRVVQRWLRKQLLWARIASLYGWSSWAGIAALTAAGMAFGLLGNLAVLRALDLPATLTLGVAMLVAAYAVGLIPAGPGQLGVFELAVSAPLVALGLSSSSAIAVAVTLHLVLLGMLGIGGLVTLPMGRSPHPPGPLPPYGGKGEKRF